MQKTSTVFCYVSVTFRTQTQKRDGSSKAKTALYWAYKRANRKSSDGEKNWERKERSKVQIFTGGVSEKQNLETPFGGGTT